MPRQTPSARHALEPAATEMALAFSPELIILQVPDYVSPGKQLFPEEMSSRARLVREWTQDFNLPLGGCLARASHPEPLTLPRRSSSKPRPADGRHHGDALEKAKMQPVMQTTYLSSITCSDALQLKTGASMMSGRGDIQSLPCFNREAGPCFANTVDPFFLQPQARPAVPDPVRVCASHKVAWLGSHYHASPPQRVTTDVL
jgi:hypothetical protein